MLAKLSIIILTAATTSAGVLTLRQQRLQAVHETARAVQNAAKRDRELRHLRAELARLSSPDRVQQLLQHAPIQAWTPIRRRPAPSIHDTLHHPITPRSDVWIDPNPAPITAPLTTPVNTLDDPLNPLSPLAPLNEQATNPTPNTATLAQQPSPVTR